MVFFKNWLEKLFEGANGGDAVTVRTAVRKLKPQEVCKQDPTGASALFVAAARGFVEVVAVLMDAIDVNLARDNGTTPLFIAAQLGHGDVVRLLMDKADVTRGTADGTTPILIAAGNGHVDAVYWLLKRADANVINQKGVTPLFAASANGHAEVVRLLMTKAHVNVPCLAGETPIFVASKRGHTDVVRFLMEKADLHATTPTGATPLFVASANGRTKIVELLAPLSNVNFADKEGYTPLFVAAMYGHTGVVRLLLEQANVNAVTNSGLTPLYIAASNGFHDVVRLLLPSSNVNFPCIQVRHPFTKRESHLQDGTTALHVAICHGHTKVVDILVDRADVNVPTNMGATPLALACAGHHFDIVALLVPRVDVDFPTQSGDTPLYVACQKGLYDMAQLLVQKADLNATSSAGLTPLIVAAQEGHLHIVQLLIDRQAYVNLPSHTGATALFVAAQCGHAEVVRLLLAAGADVDSPMHDGATPLFIAAQEGRTDVVALLLLRADVNAGMTKSGATPLLVAVQNRHVDVVKLLVGKANVNQPNHAGDCALYIAALKGFADIVEILIEKADVNVQAKSGATALYVASEKGRADIVRLLLDKTDIDLPLHTGTTPLYIACQCGHTDVVKLMLPKADVNRERGDGATTLIIASQFGHAHVVRLLLLHPRIHVNHQMADGETALHVAAHEGHVLVVRQLLRAPSISIELLNHSGRTALDMAEAHPRVLEILHEFSRTRKSSTSSTSSTAGTLRPGDMFSFDDDVTESFVTSSASVPALNSLPRDDIVEMPDLAMFRLDHALVQCLKHAGAGVACDVWQATYKDQVVAVKRLQPSNLTLGHLQALVDEIKLLSRFNSPFVLKLIGACWKLPQDLKCVVEFMDGGDLAGKLSVTTPATFSWSEKLVIVQRIVEALCYVHSFQVVHRDLKSKSIVLDSTKGAKLGGFGVSCEESDATMLVTVGSSRWMAPEVIDGNSYSSEADIYSFGTDPCNLVDDIASSGVILSELCTHTLPYANQKHPVTGAPLTEASIRAEVSKGSLRPTITSDCPPWLAQMAHACLEIDTQDRPNAYQLSHTLRQKFQPIPSTPSPENRKSPTQKTTFEPQDSPVSTDSNHSTRPSFVPLPLPEGANTDGIHRLDESALMYSKRLGAGAFGEVWLGTYQGDAVAVKKLHPYMMNMDQINGFLAEIKLMASFDSPHIVRVVGACWSNLSDVQCVMEFMNNGDLADRLSATTPDTFSWTDKTGILADIVEALCDVHASNVIHRDLKSRNVLLDSKKGTKLTDFGISKEDDHATMTEGMGTCRWMAPEVMEGDKYDCSADIYSFGMILVEMDSHDIPFKHELNKFGNPLQNVQIMLGVVKGTLKPKLTDQCPDWVRDLATTCLSYNPQERPSAFQLSHILRTRYRKHSTRNLQWSMSTVS
ncbi:Aste57867_12270 [Aphanomyces stellatus]|uniref:Aste57867_12270 protein n=1 Tax=Aphanomyces stellatus TaxID=120398 RepID=A0A485KVK6_9STRA|nr:hypothetical protein As57867_012225 [Aphanomyces stellatus]VFT89123.1 Aste57867_12270 [Aphanomyces stellatus]